MLLNSRSGIRTTDSTINYIVRCVIQTGFLATTWALVGLATYFLLQKNMVYRLFDITSGTVYTHVSGSFLVNRPILKVKGALLGHVRNTSVTRPAT
jgi:hypothetical protein